VTKGALALLAGGVLALAAALVLVLRPAPAPRASSAPVADRGAVPSGSADNGSAGGARSAARAPQDPHRLPSGVRLRYPRFGVDAAITTVRAVDGVMQVPRNPHRLGWWRDGSAPGASAGTVVVVGHVNYAGVDGVLSVLPQARPGDPVVIREPHATVRYRVAAVRTYAKEQGIPADVFAPGGAPRLVLITCGGPFDSATGNYEDNVVVYAVPG
jgi:hypothetical protein